MRYCTIDDCDVDLVAEILGGTDAQVFSSIEHRGHLNQKHRLAAHTVPVLANVGAHPGVRAREDVGAEWLSFGHYKKGGRARVLVAPPLLAATVKMAAQQQRLSLVEDMTRRFIRERNVR